MKKIVLFLCVISLLVFGGRFVVAQFMGFDGNAYFHDISNKNIILDDNDLNSAVIVFSSEKDIQKSSVYSDSCKVSSTFLFQKENLYYFQFTLQAQKCYNKNFSLIRGNRIFSGSKFVLDIEDASQTFSRIIDYSDTELLYAQKGLQSQIAIKSQALEAPNKYVKKYIFQLKKIAQYKKILYKQKILHTIIARRKFKYSLPVQGYKIATAKNVIPNARRDYRKEYTDGIHHGWDIMAPQGTQVSAIDKGIIIRVVDGFNYRDIADIKKGASLSHSEKLRNLDILRGNQVWLKTTKGDVIFYSHLNKIFNNIKEGKIISVDTPIGTIGKTGVPDKNYSNYHLHFPIQKNPYNSKKAGKYSLEDYMSWDWYLKGLTQEEVLKGQNLIFNEDINVKEKK